MIGYSNIARYKAHENYIWQDVDLASCNIIGIGETWLQHDENDPPLPSQYGGHFLNDSDGKGLAVLYKKINIPNMVDFSIFRGAYTMMKLELSGVEIVFLYISGKIGFELYKKDLIRIIGATDKPLALIGDVNWHYPKHHAMKDYMIRRGFKQLSLFPTHRQGNILDHIYVNQQLLDFEGGIEVHQKPVLFSDHDIMFLKIKCKTTTQPSPQHVSSQPEPKVIDSVEISSSHEAPTRVTGTHC